MDWCSGPMVSTKNPGHSLAWLCIRNADIRRITNQPPLSSITKSRRLTVFAHLAWMDENADASQAICEAPPENWRRPPGWLCAIWMKNIHDDLSSLDLGIHEARDLAQNRPLCWLMSLHSAMHSQRCMLLLDWHQSSLQWHCHCWWMTWSACILEAITCLNHPQRISLGSTVQSGVGLTLIKCW